MIHPAFAVCLRARVDYGLLISNAQHSKLDSQPAGKQGPLQIAQPTFVELKQHMSPAETANHSTCFRTSHRLVIDTIYAEGHWDSVCWAEGLQESLLWSGGQHTLWQWSYSKNLLQDLTLLGQRHNMCQRTSRQCVLGRGASGEELTGERWPTKTLAVELSLTSQRRMERSLEPVAM